MGRVIVATTTPDCPAELALRFENVDHEVFVLDGDLDYGNVLADVWQDGEGFVLLEHDVVPWPGAVDLLHDCDEEWCVHQYPLARGKLEWALGCARFSTSLVRRTRGIQAAWQGQPWNQIDGRLVPAVIRTGLAGPHVHEPAFAHVRP